MTDFDILQEEASLLGASSLPLVDPEEKDWSRVLCCKGLPRLLRKRKLPLQSHLFFQMKSTPPLHTGLTPTLTAVPGVEEGGLLINTPSSPLEIDLSERVLPMRVRGSVTHRVKGGHAVAFLQAALVRLSSSPSTSHRCKAQAQLTMQLPLYASTPAQRYSPTFCFVFLVLLSAWSVSSLALSWACCLKISL